MAIPSSHPGGATRWYSTSTSPDRPCTRPVRGATVRTVGNCLAEQTFYRGASPATTWPGVMSVDCTFELHVRMDDPTVARTARHVTELMIRGWDVGRAVVDDVGLVVSELVSNAVLHGRSAAKLRLCLGECLRVEVLDENTPTCR